MTKRETKYHQFQKFRKNPLDVICKHINHLDEVYRKLQVAIEKVSPIKLDFFGFKCNGEVNPMPDILPVQ